MARKSMAPKERAAYAVNRASETIWKDWKNARIADLVRWRHSVREAEVIASAEMHELRKPKTAEF